MRFLNRNFKLTLKRLSWMSLISFQILSYGSYTILVHLSEENGRISFNSTSLNFLIEFLKLIFSLICYHMASLFERKSFFKKRITTFQDHLFDGEFQVLKQNSNKLSFYKSLFFSIPAVLYCVNNNLGN